MFDLIGFIEGVNNFSGFTLGAVVLLAITLINIGVFMVYIFVFDEKNH